MTQILFTLLIFLLPTQFGKHFFFDFSYLSGVRVDYLAPTVYFTDLLVLLLAVFNWQTVTKSFTNRKCLIILVIFGLNLLFAQSLQLALYRFFKIVEFIVVFAIVETSRRDVSTLKKTLISLVFGTLIQTILVIFQFINKHSIQGIFYYLGERYFTLSTPGIAKGSLQGIEILRPYGTFSHPNSLAGFYLLLYFFVLTFKPFRFHKTLKLLFLLLSTFLIFFSFSKISILIFLILNGVYFIRKIAFGKTCRICVLARILIIVALSIIFLSLKGDPLSLDKRLELNRFALEIIKSYPLTGVGLGNYLPAQMQFPNRYPFFFQQPVHNIFLLFFAETGLLGGGFFLWKMVKLIRENLKKEVFIYIFLVVLLTGFFDHYWLTLQQNFLLLSVVFGMTLRKKNTL